MESILRETAEGSLDAFVFPILLQQSPSCCIKGIATIVASNAFDVSKLIRVLRRVEERYRIRDLCAACYFSGFCYPANIIFEQFEFLHKALHAYG